MTEIVEIPAWRDHAAKRCLNLLSKDIYRWSVDKGFWRTPLTPQSEEGERYVTNLKKSQKIALVMTELGELIEGLRVAEGPSSKILGFTNEEEEVADAIIRLLDYAGAYRLRIGEALAAKMAVNEGRPLKHGKNF